MATDPTIERSDSPSLTLDIPIIPFPDLDTTADSLTDSLTRCASPLLSPPETSSASTPDSAFFPACSSPLAPSSTTTTPLFSPVSATFSPVRRTPERRETLGRRLKIRSGVNLQVHDLKLRQYTDYDTRTGTPRSPFFSPAIWTGNTFGEREPLSSAVDPHNPFSSIHGNLSGLDEDTAVDEGPLSLGLGGPPLPILDVFTSKVVSGALSEPGIVARMRQFAESQGRARDLDFLLKVDEYTTAVKTVETLMADVALKLNGIAASMPTSAASIKLPLRMTRMLSAETREATTAMLPRLDGMFDDAKAMVEQSLAQDLYPDFLKSQLSLSLQTIGPGYSPNQVCPGFGEAFCMTDPRDTDSPILYASDGLAGLTGYTVQDIVNKNCRFMQGPGTRAFGVDRLRDAIAKNKEFSELILNFKKDGRPFWNLVFVAPLMGLDGEIAFHLGGQIDVTEMLETQEDVACVLSYVPPFLDGPSQTPEDPSQDTHQAQHTNRPEPVGRYSSSSHSTRGRRRDGGGDRSDAFYSKYPPNASRNRFFRNFLRRYSSQSTGSPTGTTINDSATDLSSPPPSLDPHVTSPYESRKSLNIPSAPTVQPFSHQVVVSPFSRFMVLEYIAPPASQGSSSGGSGGIGGCSPSDSKKTSSRHVQLPVAFCSPAAFESLGSGVRSIADVVGTNIFDVFADKANSPSVTKSFKSTVRASLAEGRNTKLDITLNGSGSGRPRTRVSSLSRRNNSGGLLCLPSPGSSHGIGGGSGRASTDVPPSSSHGRSIRTSMSLEKLVNRGNSTDCGADFVSYWTPLKDDLGSTQWVVLILVPEVS